MSEVTLSEPVAAFLRGVVADIRLPAAADNFEAIAALIVQAKKELGMTE